MPLLISDCLKLSFLTSKILTSILGLLLLASFCVLFLSLGLNNKVQANELANSLKAESKNSVTNLAKQDKDLPNFHQVEPYLYRSGEPSKEGLIKLKEMGVSTLIDLRAKSEQKYPEAVIAKELGLNYIHLTMSAKAPTKDQIERVLSEIEKAKNNFETNTNKKLLIHCAHGSDRTGCMIGIYRVTKLAWSYDEAYKEMRKYWFTPRFTQLSGTVKEYAKQAQ